MIKNSVRSPVPYRIRIRTINAMSYSIVVGISTKLRGPDLTGRHAFIMCLSSEDPQMNLMLDASGHYGNKRKSDVICGSEIKIDIESYISFFHKKQKLTAFKLRLDERDAECIYNLVSAVRGRTCALCACRVSLLLKKSGLFPGLHIYITPRALLRYMTKWAELHPEKVSVSAEAFKTMFV